MTTIAAIATPPGQGAIAVIRISGPKAFDIAEQIFSKPIRHFKTHTVHYGHILKKDLTKLDSVLLLIMKGPNSYTGEDSIEISCHGGTIITRQVLERVFEAGAIAANPGEFSMRAFLNGKIDLAQAEAVQELIAAKSQIATENAKRQLEGALSKKIASFQKELTEIAAILEAWVDFPEEGLEFASFESILDNLSNTLNKMEHLSRTFQDGKMLNTGYNLCLLGSPNVGKSSLMNALLGFDRAIVTNIAGTTRDILEEDIQIANLHFRLIDTAGIRQTEEIIEKEGIRRSQKAMSQADVVLLVLDASSPLSSQDQELIASCPKDKTIVIWNKIDVCEPKETFDAICISAKEGFGLDTLKEKITSVVLKGTLNSKDEVIITQQRHYQALSASIESLKRVIDGLKSDVSAEFVTADMRQTLYELSSIIGTNVQEDILSAIFSKFCLGK